MKDGRREGTSLLSIGFELTELGVRGVLLLRGLFDSGVWLLAASPLQAGLVDAETVGLAYGSEGSLGLLKCGSGLCSTVVKGGSDPAGHSSPSQTGITVGHTGRGDCVRDLLIGAGLCDLEQFGSFKQRRECEEVLLVVLVGCGGRASRTLMGVVGDPRPVREGRGEFGTHVDPLDLVGVAGERESEI